MQFDLIAERLLGHQTHGGVYPAFLTGNLFIEFGTFVSRVKLQVFMSNDSVFGHSDKSENLEASKFPVR